MVRFDPNGQISDPRSPDLEVGTPEITHFDPLLDPILTGIWRSNSECESVASMNVHRVAQAAARATFAYYWILL